jgi:hypothetical protein
MLTRRTADPYPERSRRTRELTWTGWLLTDVRSCDDESVNDLLSRSASKLFVKVCKSQIRKFLGPFRDRKSANFLCEPVRKSQIRKCSQNTAQLNL